MSSVSIHNPRALIVSQNDLREDLGQTTEGQRLTVYQMLHGVVQHGLYHAGQIVMLKKGAAEVMA